ncbi:MAG: hypothetical protein DWP95_00895, partial [Proteobacteria bacterium]
GILLLVRKQTNTDPAQPDKGSKIEASTVCSKNNTVKETLDKEELRLLVKILKAIGHTCEHQNISIKQGISHYQLHDTTLIFDDVSTADTQQTIHLSPLSRMLKDPNQKRPTWEKLKALKN